MAIIDSIFKRKPIEVIEAEEQSETLERHLGLFDLLMIGIGGTVGTGIFATSADIIRDTAGPAAAISWVLGGIGCILSGFAYMELSTRVPSAGSCYAYCYHSLGELPAVVGGWLLTLEYGLSGAGVARSWAAKVQEMLDDLTGGDYEWLNAEHYNLMGCAIQVICVVILLFGLQIGKSFVNVMTMTKIFVVMFMIIAGLSYLNTSYWDPFVLSRKNGQYGVSGVMLGASQAFFGYIGYDEVCCLAAEAKNPRKTMPRAVFGVIAGTCFMSVCASLALSGLAPYSEITGFASAFGYAHQEWAKHIVQFGEIVTMPVVVLISFLAQPRLQYAMAKDGLLPKIFSEVDSKGNIFWGTLISGIIFSTIALTVPFVALWDMVNFGVLLSFTMTNCSLVIIRTQKSSLNLAYPLQGLYVLFSGIAAFLWQKGVIDVNLVDGDSTVSVVFAAIFTVLAFILVIVLWWKCPQTPCREDLFSAPFVPFTPALAIAFNWYLIAQLTPKSLSYGCLWLLLAIISYFLYGFWHSIGKKNDWCDILQQLDGTTRPSSIFHSDSYSKLRSSLKPSIQTPQKV